ncbi:MULTISPECIES: isopeptide-forming domain-containing fimbrial protein [unclassified Microbacterium]|uniref:isopeptide-forming domain-containing fimbrial protein n=1 Tax=unclassified Microbacterium TaxID=2609290 RepID=UPI00300FA09B
MSVRQRIRTGTRRVVALIAAGVLLASGLVVVSTAFPTTPASAAVMQCSPSTIYATAVNARTGAGGNMYRIDVNTGQATVVADISPANNALGITDGGGTAWGMQNAGSASTRGTIVAYDGASDSTRSYRNADPNAPATIIRGAVNPANGVFYYSGNGATAYLGAFDTEAERAIGQVGNITGLQPAPSNGDFAFSSTGGLFLTTGNEVRRLDEQPPTAAGARSLGTTLLATLPSSVNSPGIAFANRGDLYVSNGLTLIRLDPATGQERGRVTVSGIPSTMTLSDLASCSYPNTLTAVKDVAGRFAPNDQFTVTVTGPGITGGNTATTAGSTTGPQDAQAGPVFATPGATYTVTETGAGSTQLSSYTATVVCVERSSGNDIPVTAAGAGRWTFTYPQPVGDLTGNVLCTVRNTPLQAGYTVAKSADPASGTTVEAGDTITYTVTGTNTGETRLDPANLRDDLSRLLPFADYNDDAVATIGGVPAGAVNRDGNTIAWSGALAVGQSVNVTYSVTVRPEGAGQTLQNTASGDATPPGGVRIVPPPAGTTHPVALPGFEVSKSADPAHGTPVDPGSTITYTVTGRNTGQTALDPVAITDDMSEVLNAAGYNDDATATIDGADAGPVTLTDTELSWRGRLAVGETVTLTYSVTVNGDAGGALLANSVLGTATPPGGAVITPPDVITRHPVNRPGFDLNKASDPASGTAVDPGETITYTLTGVNSGQTALDPVVLRDDLADEFAQYNDDASATVGGVEAGTLTVVDGVLTWTGALQRGETVTITYTVTVDADAGGQTVRNVVTGEATPPGGATITPPPDEVITPVNEPGFSLNKSADPESSSDVFEGQTITYTLTGENTGQTALAGVQLRDDLRGVLESADYNDDAVATIDGVGAGPVTFDGTVLSWDGALEIGQTVTVVYSVTVHTDAGGHTVENALTGQATPPGGDTITPPPTFTTHDVLEPGLSLLKVADPPTGSNVDPGSTIRYTVIGTNSGETPLTEVTITDDLSGVLSSAAYNDDVTATIDGADAGSVVFEGATLTWSGDLALEQEVVISFTVTVHADAGGATIGNVVNGRGVPPGGLEVVPPPSETTHEVNRPGFEVAKTSSPESGTAVDPGSTIVYTVTGTNTGETALDVVTVADDLSGLLGSADYNDDATVTIGGDGAGNVVRDGDTLSWTGALAVGQSVTLRYTVTVHGDAGGELLDNVATGSATPPGGEVITPPPAETEHPVNRPGFEMTKTADPEAGTTVEPGSTLRYILTGTNTGETSLSRVRVADDLTNVLPWADFNDDATATVNGAESGTIIRVDDWIYWEGGLEVGESVTFSFTVTVHEDAGQRVLRNHGRGDAIPPGGEEIDAPPVEIEHPVAGTPGFELAKTADPESGATVDPGSTVTYTLTGTNTGTTVLDPVELTDDLSGVLALADYNDDAVVVIPGLDAEDTPIATVEDSRLTWSGELGLGQTVTITYSVTIHDDAAGETIGNVVTGSATPPSGEVVTPPPAETEHPVAVPGFALDKTADPASGSAVDPGSTITYTVTGANTGESRLDPVTVTDDLSGVLSSADYNDDAVATIGGSSAGEVARDGDVLSWTGALGVGETVTLTYSVTVHADAAGETIGNSVTGVATPPGGEDLTPPPGETEHGVNVPGFEVQKSAEPAAGSAVDPGQVIVYTVTGENTGETVLDPATITDDLSGVLLAADFNDDATATIDGSDAGAPTRDGDALSWTGVLQPGQIVTITYSVTVRADAGGQTVRNAVTSTGTPPGGEVITPPDVTTEHPVNEPGFEVEKSADPASGTAVAAGDRITYTLTGRNTGETVLDPVVLNDDLSGVLPHAQYDEDAAATIDGADAGPVGRDGDTLSWSGALPVGATVTVTYSVTVMEGSEGQIVRNSVTGVATPPGGGQLTPPPAVTEHPVPTPGFETSKTADPPSGTEAAPGQTITYTLTGANTGEVALDPVTLADDMSGVTPYAAYNDDATASIGGATVDGVAVDGDRLSWRGVLHPGEVVTVTYTVTVREGVQDVVIANRLTASATPPGGAEIVPPPTGTENPVPKEPAPTPSPSPTEPPSPAPSPTDPPASPSPTDPPATTPPGQPLPATGGEVAVSVILWGVLMLVLGAVFVSTRRRRS